MPTKLPSQFIAPFGTLLMKSVLGQNLGGLSTSLAFLEYLNKYHIYKYK